MQMFTERYEITFFNVQSLDGVGRIQGQILGQDSGSKQGKIQGNIYLKDLGSVFKATCRVRIHSTT